MKTIPLTNGRTMFEAELSLVVTQYDLVAVVMWAIAKKRPCDSREAVVEMFKRMIEAVGTQGLVRRANRFKVHHREAEVVVAGLFPELKPTRAAKCEPSAN